MKRLFLFLPLVLAVVLGYFLYAGIGKDPHILHSAMIGHPVPSFDLPLLQQPARKVGPSALKGQVRLLNVWATWCPTCEAEHAYLKTLAAKGIPIIGLNYKDDRSSAIDWLQQRGNPYRFVMEDPKGTLGFDLGVYGAPETFLIDAKGVVRYRRVGAMDAQVWQDKLKPLYEKYVRLAAQQKTRGS